MIKEVGKVILNIFVSGLLTQVDFKIREQQKNLYKSNSEQIVQTKNKIVNYHSLEDYDDLLD